MCNVQALTYCICIFYRQVCVALLREYLRGGTRFLNEPVDIVYISASMAVASDKYYNDLSCKHALVLFVFIGASYFVAREAHRSIATTEVSPYPTLFFFPPNSANSKPYMSDFQ